mmetsp:Transcript_10263/g.22399  ORF Transcript_10263/g.22399 Transcript_10263/m.22399 type:complete len:494 (+) Transcript_10263:103-1584(+)
MVDVKIDVPPHVPATECFLAVRVGETQKLSRLSGNRMFSFPQAGDRRFGKIEVYQRIGGCGVDLDYRNEGVRRLLLPCGVESSVSLGVEVSPPGAAQDPRANNTREEKHMPSTRSKAVKEYMRHHSLELQLSEAMQAVLKVMPEDPNKLLCQVLQSNAQSQGGTSLALPNKKVDLPLSSPLNLPFHQYYAAHFHSSLPASAWVKVYARFPGPAKKEVVAKQEALLPSLPELDPVECLRLQACEALTRAVCNGKLMNAVGQVPSATTPYWKKPSVGSWLIVPSKPAKAAPASPSPSPSAPQHCQQEATRNEVPGASVATDSKKEWAVLPSVGTWSLPKPKAIREIMAPNSEIQGLVLMTETTSTATTTASTTAAATVTAVVVGGGGAGTASSDLIISPKAKADMESLSLPPSSSSSFLRAPKSSCSKVLDEDLVHASSSKSSKAATMLQNHPIVTSSTTAASWAFPTNAPYVVATAAFAPQLSGLGMGGGMMFI